jgi:hypothetical protein
MFIDEIMIAFQSIFLSINMSYIVWGIKDKMESRLKWITLILFSLIILYHVDYLLKEIVVLITAAFMIIYYWLCYHKTNGDNIINSSDIVNYNYFHYVNKKILNLKVLFPLDIGNNKKNRKVGNIRKVGKSLSGKYQGEIVCLIESEGRFYICPVKNIYPIEILKEQDHNILAHTENESIKLLNWDSDQCKGYFSVVVL